MEKKIASVKKALMKDDFDEDYQSFQEQMKGSIIDYSDLMNLVIENPSLLDRHIQEGKTHNIIFLQNTSELIENIKFKDKEIFERVVRELQAKDALFEFVRAEFTNAFGNLEGETAQILVGDEKTCDIAVVLLRRGRNFNSIAHMNVLKRLRIDLIHKRFPVIDYVGSIAPEIKAEWDMLMEKARAFIEQTQQNISDINYKTITSVMDEFLSDDTKLGFTLDLYQSAETAISTDNPLIKDLENARFLRAVEMIDEVEHGPLATAQFIQLVLEKRVDFKPKDLAFIAKNSDSFAEQIKNLSAKEIKPLISIDPSLSLFHRLKWNDKRIMREIISQDLGL